MARTAVSQDEEVAETSLEEGTTGMGMGMAEERVTDWSAKSAAADPDAVLDAAGLAVSGGVLGKGVDVCSMPAM